MKTTLDLPDALVRQIELRAEREGRDIQEIVADLLATGVSPAGETNLEKDRVVSKNLPMIKLRPAQPSDVKKLSTQEWCDWIKDIDLQQEVERYEKAFGHQHVDRADD